MKHATHLGGQILVVILTCYCCEEWSGVVVFGNSAILLMGRCSSLLILK